MPEVYDGGMQREGSGEADERVRETQGRGETREGMRSGNSDDNNTSDNDERNNKR